MIFKFGYPCDRIDQDETRIEVGYLAKFIGALYHIGYNEDVIIEYEDPVFSKERKHEGLKLGLKHLRLFVLWVLSKLI